MSFEERYYENDILWEADRYLENKQEVLRMNTAANLLPSSVKTILDVGCGNGAFLYHLESGNNKLELLGIERSKAAVAKKLCRTDIQIGDITALPFPDNSFDCVSCMEVLEHLPVAVYDKALKELQRVAKEFILVTVPYKEKRPQMLCDYCSCIFNPNYHMRSYNDNNLQSLFSDFVLKEREEIYNKQFILAPALRKIRNLKRYLIMQSKHICPQCGYSPKADELKTNKITNTKDRAQARYNLKELVKSVWPTRNKPQWFLGIYQNSTDNS
jgi:ubiquinone/menaquinone biosynthesis C-methylase UbiE